MRTRNPALVTAMCAGLAAVLAGCGGDDPDAGTNGVGKLSPDKIEKKARTAADRAATVHLSGSVVSKGHTYKLNMRLNQDGGTGRVTSGSRTFTLLRVGKDLYLKADADFWTRSRDDGKSTKQDEHAAGKLDGKYVRVPPKDPSYQQLSGFTDKDSLLDGLLSLRGEVSTGDRSSVGETKTIRISGDSGEGGTLDVSLEDTPYPLRLRRAGGAGELRLTEWNKKFTLTAPKKKEKVDYGEQIPTGK